MLLHSWLKLKRNVYLKVVVGKMNNIRYDITRIMKWRWYKNDGSLKKIQRKQLRLLSVINYISPAVFVNSYFRGVTGNNNPSVIILLNQRNRSI